MPCILIIDDEDDARRVVRQKLEREGYEVIEAENGSEGLQRYRTCTVDLIITDILMPEKEGLETIQDIRRENPGAKIIAISGGGRTGNLDFLQVASKLGAQRTLHKPFRLQEMVEVVRELLQQAPDIPPTSDLPR